MVIQTRLLNFMAPEAAQVLVAISDEISFNMFIIIKNNARDTESLRDGLNISSKQCHDRIVKLVDTGLVKGKGRYYSITSFGRLIFQAQAKVGKAIENLSKLKIVDAIRDSEFPEDQRTKLINEFIHDDELREMIGNCDIK
jgi:DNA-binding Lrp family transcriptional regulator